MADLNLDVHDIAVTDQHQFTPTGGTQLQRRVTYFVGVHGPFTLTYDVADATPARIKGDIAKQVDDLRSIHELGT